MAKIKTVTAAEAAAILNLSPGHARRVMESAGISPTFPGFKPYAFHATAVKTLAKSRTKTPAK